MTGQNSGTPLFPPRKPFTVDMNFDNGGIPIYIPRYIAQASELNFGETVTHEDYNEKLNKNITANDHHSYILDLLFNVDNPDAAIHVPYLDKIVDENDERYTKWKSDLDKRIDDVDTKMETTEGDVLEMSDVIRQILAGTRKVGVSESSDSITGVDTAANYHYYGTGMHGGIGFHPVPDTISAIQVEHEPESVDGIYFIPGMESIAEQMLNPALQAKVNRTFIADYDELTGRPYINGVMITGQKSLAQLGIQPVGNYLTAIPSAYVQRPELDVYALKTGVTSEINTHNSSGSAHNDIRIAISTAQSAAQSYASSIVSSSTNRVFVNGGTPSGAKTGDLWVTT